MAEKKDSVEGTVRTIRRVTRTEGRCQRVSAECQRRHANGSCATSICPYRSQSRLGSRPRRADVRFAC